MKDDQYLHRPPPKFDDAETPKPRPASPPQAPPKRAAPVTRPPAAPTADDAASRSAAPAVVSPKRDAPDKPEKTVEPTLWWHWGVLVVIAGIALWLRLRDPLSSNVIGAEDPYLHMERTWNLVQGKDIADYPLGLMVLLFLFTALGAHEFYLVARFVPPLFGVVAVVGLFLLCRRYMHPAGALTASLLFAVMRETIIRTSILFPTALDLALIPFFFLAVLAASEGKRWGLPWAGGLAVVFFFVHPWALALVLVPVGLYWLVMLLRDRRNKNWAPAAAVGGSAAILGVLWILPIWRPTTLVFDHALPRLATIIGDPGSLLPLPAFVDLPWMVSWAVMLLAGGGVVLAVLHRTRLALLALLWTFFLLPLVLVDWFDIWFVPHRTVAYLAIGLAILGAIPISALARTVREVKPHAQTPATLGAMAIVLVLTLPAAIDTDPWYRVYDQDDYDAWAALDERGTAFVMAGSWQARAGYRALTGRDAEYNPGFFQSEVVRNYEIQKHPDVVVLVDNWTVQAKMPTEFLKDWNLVGEWGEVRAYTRS